jgi:hypothetical protein
MLKAVVKTIALLSILFVMLYMGMNNTHGIDFRFQSPDHGEEADPCIGGLDLLWHFRRWLARGHDPLGRDEAAVARRNRPGKTDRSRNATSGRRSSSCSGPASSQRASRL